MKKLMILLIALMAIGSIFAVALNESFDGATFPPLGWTVTNGGDANAWIQASGYARTGTYSAGINYGATAHDDWLITPKLAPAAGNTVLSFWARNRSASYIDQFNVKLSTTTSATSSFTTTLASNVGPGITYTEYTYDLAAYVGQQVYVAIQATSTDMWALYIDDVTGPEVYVPAAPEFVLSPSVSSWDFGNLVVNTTGTKQFTITNAGGGSLDLTSVTATGSYYSISVAPTDMFLGPLESTTFTVQYAAPATAGGPYAGNVAIVHTLGTTNITLSGSSYDPTITSFPWLVTFGDVAAPTFPPADWAKYSGALADPTVLGAAGTGSWVADDWLNTVTTPYNKAGAINIYGTANGWLVSPPIAMPGVGYQLEFDLALMKWNTMGGAPDLNGLDDIFMVLIGDGTSWTPANVVAEWNNAAKAFVYNDIPTTGVHITMDLAGYSGTKYVAFYGISTLSDADNDLFVDNVLIRATPAGAPDPVTLVSPAAEATGLLKAGFNMTWTPAITGGIPDDFTVFISTDPDDMLGQFSGVTTENFLNPVGMPFEAGTFAFVYGQRYYWQVFANGAGSEVPSEVRWFEIEADPAIVLPHTQSFDAATIPSGWTQTYSGAITSNRWTAANSANAGGTAYEMMNTYTNAIGITRLITPPIGTAGLSTLSVNFNHLLDDYGPGYTAKLQYSYDLTTWFDSPWSVIGGGGDVSGNTTVLIPGISSATTYVAWVMDGNHYQYDYWYVDDVTLSAPLDHDVSALSIDMYEVVPAVAMTPTATVGNNGLNTETFDVTMTIGTYTSTKQVVALASGATTQVVFDSITPTLYSAEAVEVTTLLATDELVTNDVINGVLICLPLDVNAYADRAYNPGGLLGPASFNLSDPATITDLPALPAAARTNFIPGADWVEGGMGWYGSNYIDPAAVTPFWQVNNITGLMTGTGTTNLAYNGVAYDGTNNVWYGCNGINLYTFDPLAGTETLVGAFGVDYAGLMIGLAHDNFTGILYGIDLGYDALFTIDKLTGAATVVGTGLGIDLNYAQDCAFDQNNGLLYLAGYSATGALYWVDTTNGGAYIVGNFANAAEMTGFAIPHGVVAPLDAPVVTIAADGTLSWAAVPGAAIYTVYGSDDPYAPAFDFVTNLGSEYTSYLDPNFGVDGKKFYKVTASAWLRNTPAERAQINGQLPVKTRTSTITPKMTGARVNK